jgi:hypothetical protein
MVKKAKNLKNSSDFSSAQSFDSQSNGGGGQESLFLRKPTRTVVDKSDVHAFKAEARDQMRHLATKKQNVSNNRTKDKTLNKKKTKKVSASQSRSDSSKSQSDSSQSS